MDHAITMAKNHDFLPIGSEGKAKKMFFMQRHLWDVPHWTNVRTGDQSTGPHQTPSGPQGLGPGRGLNSS